MRATVTAVAIALALTGALGGCAVAHALTCSRKYDDGMSPTSDSPATVIQTPRLILRRFSPDDWADLHEYLSQPETLRYEPYDVYSVEQARQEAQRRSGDPAFWAVVLCESRAADPAFRAVVLGGKVIGNVWLARGDFDTWELGYVFNCCYWGHGYATEACRAALGHAFSEWGAHRVVATVNPANEPSWRLLERLGFRREGHLRSNVFFRRDASGDPAWQDTYEYGLLASEWQA